MKNILTKRKDYAILNFHRLKQVVFICSYLFMTDKNTENTENTKGRIRKSEVVP